MIIGLLWGLGGGDKLGGGGGTGGGGKNGPPLRGARGNLAQVFFNGAVS